MLERLRFDVSTTRGRRRPEPDHPYRNAFQRDRDRIVHSRAFRRLQEKTQVFTAPSSDHVRNRLTHTIEVAQVARTAARALQLNEDLAEALALGHDLGHPPFGHAGEQILDESMQRCGDRFDHNIHALRIVERFERRYAAFDGLNLTYEVREGLLKHSRDFTESDYPALAEYDLSSRPTIEAQLVDPTDEIAYNCADLDDAIESKALDLDLALEEVSVFGELFAQAKSTHPTAEPWGWFNEALRGLLGFFVTSLIDGTVTAASEAGVESSGDVRTLPTRLVRLTEEGRETTAQLKELLTREVYRSTAVSQLAEESGQKLRAVFNYYMEAPEKLPRSYRNQADQESRHRAVCDYIAGMTDTFLLRQADKVV